MELEKIKIAIEKNTPFVAVENGKYVTFEGIDLESATKDQIDKLAKKFNTNLRNIVLESLYKSDIENLDSPIYFQLIQKLHDFDRTDFANEMAATSLLQSYIQRDRVQMMNRLKQKDKQQSALKDEFEKYPSFPTTKFIQDTKEIRKVYEIADPHEIFNSIETSEQIPFAYLNYYNDQDVYKIYKSSKDTVQKYFDDKLFAETPVYIIMYYKNTPVFIEFFRNEMIISFEVSLKETKVENIILGSIKKDIVLKQIKKEGIRGNFAVKDFILNREIFLDIIMNDPIISKTFFVDESRKAGSGKKDEEELRSIYLNYEPKGEKPVNVFISQKTSGRNDPFVLEKYIPLFSDYLSIRISKIDSLESVDKYREIFGKLLGVYNKKFEELRKEYAKYIPRFNNLKKDVDKKVGTERNLKQLQRAAPDIFIQGYSKKSEAKSQPRIYDSKNPEHKELEIMVFEDLHLVCPPKYPHPGLKKSTLDNKDKYPYIPNCYKTKNKNYDMWKRYEAGEDIEITKSGKSTSKKVQKKALGPDQQGLLPRNIYFLLGSNDEYYRSGTPFDNNSLIHAVLQGVDKEYLEASNKKEYVNDIRRGFASNARQQIVQQLWDKTQSEIESELVKNVSEFDSKIFIGYLQEQYEIKIYVLSSLEDFNGTFEIPRYTQAYLAGNFKKTVLIYKHLGSEGQNLKKPHYELIRGEKAVFKTNSKIITRLEKYYKRCYHAHNLGLRFSKNIEFDSQIVDSYGKTRGLLFDEYEITMWVSPQSPEIKPGLEREIYPASSLENVQSFLEENNLKIVSKNIENGKIIGIKTNAFDYSYIDIIPTDDVLSDIPADGYSLQSERGNDNILTKTFDNRKIANFMVQLMLYQFSLFIENNEFEPENENLQLKLLNQRKYYNTMLKKYVKSFVVKPDHDFLESVPRELSLNNSFFDGNSLIVDSEETARKLQWVLYYYVNTDIKTVLEYKNRQYLENYYILPSDYKQWPETIILIGEKSLEDWLIQETIDFRVIEIPEPDIKKVQFWISWTLGKGINIVQNARDLKSAVYISDNYLRQSYNAGYDVIISEDYESPDYNEITMKNGILIVKNFDSNLPTVYRHSNDSFAAVMITGY
jgi:hypothetical protein